MKNSINLVGFDNITHFDVNKYVRKLQRAFTDTIKYKVNLIHEIPQHIPQSSGAGRDLQFYMVYLPVTALTTDLNSFIDQMSLQFCPSLILAQDIAPVSKAFAGSGIPLCSINEPVEHVAIRIQSLIQRQAAISGMEDELRLATRQQKSLRIEIEKVQEELQLAATVQRGLLPKCIPEIGDVRFGIMFRPTGYVSGDIYDVKRLDEHTVGFFLADAVGHGVPAALMTMVINKGLHTKQIKGTKYEIIPPSEVLYNLNQEMLNHQGLSGRFATGVYGIIDTESHTVTIAVAGHPPPIIIQPDGKIRKLELAGGLLGVFPDENYEQCSFVLDKSERLIIHSDGFETAFPDVKADEFERRRPTEKYLAVFKDVCKPEIPVEQSIKQLDTTLDNQLGSLHQIDDLTALCISAGDVQANILKRDGDVNDINVYAA